MKKLFAAILTVCVILSLAACGGEEAPVIVTGDELGGAVGEVKTDAPVTTEAPAPVEPAKNYPDNILMKDRHDTSTANVFENEKYYRTDIASVTVLDTLANKPADAWDVSDEKNGTVWAWVDEGMNLFIAGEGGVTAKSCTELFAHYEEATAFNFGGNFYTDITEDLYRMFLYCKSLETIDLNSFNVSNTDNFGELFYGCHNLRSVALESWDTSSSQSFGAMFQNCIDLEQVDVSHFKTHNAISIGGMFWGCEKLTSVGDLGGWDVSKVKYFKWMFSDCYKLTSVGDLSGWDTSSASSMYDMFAWCKSLTSIGDLKIPDGCDTEGMFEGTSLQ
ncbi:MAG: BspA family leucine-rich repeat surface protein [Clostridia bacterium]|nr:BspA family leucine-rich repeat surface protein [Clostridia bacterium]